MASSARHTLFVPAALASVALFGGCALTSVRVVQKVPAERPYTSVYVIVYESSVSSWYAHRLAEATMRTLGAHTGTRAGRVLTGLEFDTRAVDQEIDRVGAQAVLRLTPIGSRTARYGEIVELTYGATLEDRASNRPVWSAKVEIDGAVDGGIQDVADKLVWALASDRLIPPVLAASNGVGYLP